MSKKEKWKMIKIIAIFVAFSIIFGKESLAANFIVRNVSNTNQIYFIVNGTTGYVGIGTGNPAYPLYVIGDVYWSGTLQGGIVPWARLQGYNLDVAWSGKLGWGNLTGYNLNVPWTGLLGWGNLTGYDLNVNWIGKLGWGNLTGYNLNVPWTGLLGWGNLTGYDLNVNWIGKLGWGNLTGYPSIIAGAGLTGGGELSTSRILSIAFGEDFLGWRNLTAYPSPCPAGHAVQAIGDTLTCINLNSTGNVTGVGTTNALTYWTSPNTIGALGFGTAGQFLKSQGSGNLPLWSTIYLGTDTEGNYVAGITAGTGIVVSGTAGEGWSPTVAIDTSIVPRKNVADTINAPWTFAENVWFNKNVFIAGNLSYVNVNTLNVNGSMIPIFSGQFDVGNLTYKWRNVTAVNIVGDNVYSGGNPVLTTATSFSNVAASDITVSGTYNSLNLQINAGAVGTNEIADNAVTMSKISLVSCPSGYALVSIGGGSYACIQINATQGVINGSGIVNYIPVFTGVSTIGASQFYLTSNNLNLGQQSLINASWVNASYLNVSAGLVVLPSGNVGVGTTSPVKKLDVVGDINATGAVYSVSGYYVGVNQIITSGRVLQNIASISQSLLPTTTNTYDLGSSSLRWRDLWLSRNAYIAGNVGIGTTSPTATLHISSTNPAGAINIVNTTTGASLLFVNAITGNVGIGTTTPEAKLDVNGNLWVRTPSGTDTRFFNPVTGTWTHIPWTDGRIYLRSTGVWIDDGASLYVSGNVGIGTTTPGAKLHVAGSGWLSYFGDTNRRVGIWSGGTGTASDPYRAIFGTPDTAEVRLNIAGTDHLTITTSGNVGIGTTTPSSKLEVYNGDIEINDGQATGTYKIKGLRVFYAGDETQVSTTSTSPELKKQFTSVFDSNYGIKPSYVNVIARIWNGASGRTTYLNVTLEGCNGIILSATSTSATVVKGSISVATCSDGLYPAKVYLYTTSGGTAYNDLIEFYYVG